MSFLIKPCRKVHGILKLPGDKSISHRAIIISAIAKGNTRVKNFSFSDDCKLTLQAIRSMGVRIEKKSGGVLIVYGRGISGLKKPRHTIDVGESGTSMRLLIGLLSAQGFSSGIDGKAPLRKRPMLRVIRPLRLMGAEIKARKKGRDEYPPIDISPAQLRSLSWHMKIPSAQVKSAIMFAALYADKESRIYESILSRDHTERMLRYFKADIKTKAKRITIGPCSLVSPKNIYIPSDISSASFFMVAACLLKNSYVKIKNVCLNPSRSGIIEALKMMGASIKVIHTKRKYFDPYGDVVVRSSRLKAFKIGERLVPKLIDELPILMVAASLASGTSVFSGVGELKVKETNRIRSMVENLSKMGVSIETKVKANKEVIVIRGGRSLKGSYLKSFGDHRTAMSMIVAGLCADSPSRIDNINCISKSFPDFLKHLRHLIVP
ncbi:3-phosphoshikimate 1-carboxyvinyltransferase [Thermoproteota archaeon]